MFEVLAVKASPEINVHVIFYRLDGGHDNDPAATNAPQGIRQDQGKHHSRHQVRHEGGGRRPDWSTAVASACFLSAVETWTLMKQLQSRPNIQSRNERTVKRTARALL
ncbi:hypothetical protein E2C01_097722 [Portunus trituberculatus]|uniref:Uncharacterized protein n=1 Tax=Portunus trituberculatus TaxID=210409 RepID=A0A5B7K143_PORTR|nr:hypothetical protein [Portunus trituberculatus]